MRKIILKSFFLCLFLFLVQGIHAQVEVDDDWGGEYVGRRVTTTEYHICGSFFDKVPLSLSTQWLGGFKNYNISFQLPLFAPCRFPSKDSKMRILLKKKNGEMIELEGTHASGGEEKRETYCDGKKYYRYVAFLLFYITEEKLREIITSHIVKIRFETKDKPLDKVIQNNDFSRILGLSYISIQKKLHPELFKDELKEGF